MSSTEWSGIVFLSDLHLSMDIPVGRTDDTVKTQFHKLEFILDYAKKEGAIILQAGDFFDKPRSWFVLPRVIRLLRKYNVPIYSIFGQHDTYMYSEITRENTSLGILEAAGLVTILDDRPRFIFSPAYEIDMTHPIRLFGASWGQEVPIPPDRNLEPDRVIDILVIHAPIAIEWAGCDFIPAEDFLTFAKFDGILCGDIHREFFIEDGERFILNTGPLTRREVITYNFEHKPNFYYWREGNEKIFR